jgi:hypothetical protein
MSNIGLYSINLLALVKNLDGSVVTNNDLLWNLYIQANSTGTNDITITNYNGSS